MSHWRSSVEAFLTRGQRPVFASMSMFHVSDRHTTHLRWAKTEMIPENRQHPTETQTLRCLAIWHQHLRQWTHSHERHHSATSGSHQTSTTASSSPLISKRFVRVLRPDAVVSRNSYSPASRLGRVVSGSSSVISYDSFVAVLRIVTVCPLHGRGEVVARHLDDQRPVLGLDLEEDARHPEGKQRHQQDADDGTSHHDRIACDRNGLLLLRSLLAA